MGVINKHNQILNKLDEVLAQFDKHITLKCPVCGVFVNFKHTLKLGAGLTMIHCPGCSADFEVEVRKID